MLLWFYLPRLSDTVILENNIYLKTRGIPFCLVVFYVVSPKLFERRSGPWRPTYVLRETEKNPNLTCECLLKWTQVASRRSGSPDICCAGRCLNYLQGKPGRKGRWRHLSLYSSLFILQMPSFEIWDIQKIILMTNKNNVSDIARNTDVSLSVKGYSFPF